tara:strand:- start:832 stop:1653 length:822 start_codon:yes stop_codon:yes gene_type:complete
MATIENPSFFSTDFKTGLVYDNSDNQFSTKLYSWDNEPLELNSNNSSFYIYVHKGPVRVYSELHNENFWIYDKMYMCTSGNIIIEGGRGIVMEKLEYNNTLFTIGGPIEGKGKYKYIDGCSDSLLISPVKMGDPCLNALYFPKDINQTSHTHPSMRVGMVTYGSGWCITPWEEIPLYEGQIFLIHEGYEDTYGTDKGPVGEEVTYNNITAIKGAHSFRTEDSGMCVIAYHPDSDFGPTDDEHPMVNRTIVDGKRVNEQTEIRTKKIHGELWQS